MKGTPAYMHTLIELFQRGAAAHPIQVSTSELGASLGMSQQGISKHLIQLEALGLIDRERLPRSSRVLVTKKGSDAVIPMYVRLKEAVEGRPRTLEFRGHVFSGLGEGAYYISLPGYSAQFEGLLGFKPFPGTLNLVLDQSQLPLRKELNVFEGLPIEGFKDGGRTYGPVKCFKAKVESKYEAGALVIERTHHGEAVLEVISPLNLRKTLSLRDGDMVSVSVFR